MQKPNWKGSLMLAGRQQPTPRLGKSRSRPRQGSRCSSAREPRPARSRWARRRWEAACPLTTWSRSTTFSLLTLLLGRQSSSQRNTSDLRQKMNQLETENKCVAAFQLLGWSFGYDEWEMPLIIYDICRVFLLFFFVFYLKPYWAKCNRRETFESQIKSTPPPPHLPLESPGCLNS